MKTKTTAIVLSALLIIPCLAGCSQSGANSTPASSPVVSGTAQPAGNTTSGTTASGTPDGSTASVVPLSADVADSDANISWDDSATKITLNGSSASVTGTGASVNGSIVTITAKGTYVVSGVLSDGQIVIAAGNSDKVHLVLNGADITNKTGSPIYASQCDKLIVTLAEGVQNTLTDGGSAFEYADTTNEEPNAALFSKDDLTINGTGSLTVNAGFNNGIGTKDDLLIVSGDITVNAANHGLRGNDSVTILDGSLDITAGNDGIQTNNTEDASLGWILIEGGSVEITAGHDGIQAETTLQIDGGTFNISTGGGWPGGSLKRGSHTRTNEGVVSGINPTDGSYKGLKSGGSIVISNGMFTISAYEDAVHSDGDITINGGELILQSGKQSIHADKTVTVNSGTIDIKNSFEGIEGTFIDLNGGKIDIFSTDDGINISSSSGLLTIAGGDIYINAGGDGIDSNNNAVMTGGTVYVDGPTAADDWALDYQNQFPINGGTLVAVCLNGMPQAPSSSSGQNSIMVYYSSAQKAGTEITLKSSDGTVIISYTPQKDYSSVVISTPELKQSSTYTLYAGGTKLCDITLSANITSVSDSGAAVSGGMGGRGGGQKSGGGMGGRGPGG